MSNRQKASRVQMPCEPLWVRGDVCVEEQPPIGPSDEACRTCGAAGRRYALTDLTVARIDSILSCARVSFLSVCTQCVRNAQPRFYRSKHWQWRAAALPLSRQEGAVARRWCLTMNWRRQPYGGSICCIVHLGLWCWSPLYKKLLPYHEIPRLRTSSCIHCAGGKPFVFGMLLRHARCQGSSSEQVHA